MSRHNPNQRSRVLIGLCLLLVMATHSILAQPEAWTSPQSRAAVCELLNYQKQPMTDHGTFEFAALQKLLLAAHPNDVNLDEVAARVTWEERLIAKRHLIEGVIFPLRVEIQDGRTNYYPVRAGDMALYTGFYLSGLIFRYLATHDVATLRNIAVVADGMYRLTHITGTPGMLVRYALPLATAEISGMMAGDDHSKKAWIHIYYENAAQVKPEYGHLKTIVAGKDVPLIATSPAAQALDPQRRHYGSTYYYTRTTRDQMTGIAFGLAVAVYFLEPDSLARYGVTITPEAERLLTAIRTTTQRTAFDIFRYLHQHDWEMQDPLADDPGTMSNDVSDLLKLSVQMLARRCLMNAWLTGQDRAQWQELFAMLRSYDRELLPTGIATTLSLSHPFTAAGWWSLTWNYYAWNLRTARLFAIVLLDDVHPAFARVAPPQWPVATLTRVAANERNRAWLEFWKERLWRHVHDQSNPWFVYLFNYMRRIVLERHCGSEAMRKISQDGMYELDGEEFNRQLRLSDAETNAQLREALFGPIRLDGQGRTRQIPVLGLDLARCHFHLRSLAITPIRTYATPCYFLPQYQWQRCKSQTSEPVYPPHLMEPARFWTCGYDFRVGPDLDKPPDKHGNEERTMICLPTLYWLAKVSGQLDAKWQAYPSRYFRPYQH